MAPCPAGQEYCCGSALIACGTLQTVPATAIMPAAGQASFGEYPWQVNVSHMHLTYLLDIYIYVTHRYIIMICILICMTCRSFYDCKNKLLIIFQAIILTKQNDYIAGGVLIDQLNILTVTHRLSPYV